MKITQLHPFILHVPVTNSRIADSVHTVTYWGAVGVIVETDAGIRGYGYTGTLGYLPADRLIRDCIGEVYAPLLIGEDPQAVRAIWSKLYRFHGIQWVGRAGITQMALAAIDIAIWDIKAKASAMPLWELLGGSESKKLEAYNTDGGWLNWTLEELVRDARSMVDQGFRGIKIKIGSPDPNDDLRRIAAVREAIGPDVKLMVDGNGRWDLPTAKNHARRFKDFDVVWFEEPMWFDDVRSHAALALAIETPIALGEQLYSLDAFSNFIEAGAVHYVQPDATRLGGITPWWQVADLALAHRLPVVAHAGDMMQVHQHLSFAHAASDWLEYIPWLRGCFEEPATVAESYFEIPQMPGAGTTLRADALERFGVS